MRIAIVAPTEMPSRRANTIQVAKMAQAFVKLGHDVRVAIPIPNKKKLGEVKALSWDKMAHHYGLQIQFPLEWLVVNQWMRRYDYGLMASFWAQRWHADLIYTRLPQCALIASLLRFPVIYELHDFPKGNIAQLIIRGFMKGLGKHRLIVITNALLHQLSQKILDPKEADDTIVAPDGVDLERFVEIPAPVEARRKIGSKIDGFIDRFSAGYSGHFYKGRGIELIIELATCLPDINFLIMGGENSEVDRIRGLIRGRNIKNVFITGFISNAELPIYQACCEVLLMPYQEQVAASSGGDIASYLSPMKLFEYLACGRVIISSNIPVLREILSDKIAFLLPPDDVGAWVATLKRVKKDDSMRIRISNSAKKEAEKYNWERRAAKILADF